MATIRQRGDLAANPRTPRDTLRALASDNNWAVRHAVASNTSTPTDLLEVLAQDTKLTVRLGVADNWQTAAINIALRSDDHQTRARVAHRPDLTPTSGKRFSPTQTTASAPRSPWTAPIR